MATVQTDKQLKLTLDEFQKLDYDVKPEFGPTTKNLLKQNDTGMKIFKMNTNNIKLVNVFEMIKQNLDLLATIESDEMCIPLHLAKHYLKRSILSLEINRDGCEDQNQTLLANWQTPLFDLLEQLFIIIEFGLPTFDCYVDSSREKFFKKLFDILKLEFTDTTQLVNKNEVMLIESFQATCKAVFVFKASDINAAVHQIVNSFDDPFNNKGIRSVYVQENCFTDFCEIITKKLRPYPKEVLRDQYFITEFDKILQIIDKLSAKTIQAQPFHNEKTVPTICLNFGRQFYDSGVQNIAPIINMQSFRTVKEVIGLLENEQGFEATIWANNYSVAYEIVKKSNFSFIELNCHDISHYPLYRINNFVNHYRCMKNELFKCPQSGVIFDDNQHFQFFEDKSGSFKIIVCSFGDTFAN